MADDRAARWNRIRFGAYAPVYDLAGVVAALGLAENLASLRALVSEGIQAGHMKLHAKNVAVQAGAPEELVDEIAARMVAAEDVRESRARELRDELA